MTRLSKFCTLASLSLAAISVAAPTASAGGCGPDGQILTRTDLLTRLGGNAVLEGFEAFSIGLGGAVNLDVTCLNDASIANGQGPNLVQPGATYCDPSGVQLQWNGDQYFARTTKTILSNGATGSIHMTYTQTVKAMGVDLSAFSGWPYTGTATIYDTANAVIGTVPFSMSSGGTERFFVGWAHTAGIGRVEIVSATYPWSPKIDDHAYGDCDGGLGTKYCTANANSTGSPADIAASGTASAAAGDLTLDSSPVPDQNGIFFHGMSPSQTPFGNGFLCASGNINRGAVIAGSGNLATYTYDNSDAKHSLGGFAGMTRHFQYWFRDPMGGGALFNTSNAISIAILP
jgi:hypothetical protein